MDISLIRECAGGQQYMTCQAPDGSVHVNDYCVIENAQGTFLAKVNRVLPLREGCADKCAGKPGCALVRKASPADIEKAAKNQAAEKKAFEFCMQRIATRELPMKMVEVEYLLDSSKAVFYFTADGRVDFRELVRDLAYELRTRIEMKQIGVRDEARMLGGYGCCGVSLCCATFLSDFEPVSIRMAKLQNLTLDPAKISGACGRLMCCLGYEYEHYEKSRKTLPKVGESIVIDGEAGKIKSLDVLTGVAYVAFAQGKTTKYTLDDLIAKREDAKCKRKCESCTPAEEPEAETQESEGSEE